MKLFYTIFFTLLVGALYFQGFFSSLSSKLNSVSKYKTAALMLAKENRELRAELTETRFSLKKVEAKNNFYAIKLGEDTTKGRSIASTDDLDKKLKEKDYHDFVKFDVYQWSPDKLLAIAQRELKYKKFEKSAQYYQELIERFPNYEEINDKVFFSAGVAAYESKKHNDWAIAHLNTLLSKYPQSEFYRGAKLWLALSHYRSGDRNKFIATVEEFRLKYRNTEEWKFLSQHYEEILAKSGN